MAVDMLTNTLIQENHNSQYVLTTGKNERSWPQEPMEKQEFPGKEQNERKKTKLY